MVPDSNLIISSVATLLAVALGAGVSILTQARASAREGSQHWRQVRIACYGRFMGAVRAYIAYARRAGALRDPADAGVANAHDIADPAPRYIEGVEVALAEVRLLARFDYTVRRAEALVKAIEGLGFEAQGAAGQTTSRPVVDLEQVTIAEREFVEAARRELKAGDRRISGTTDEGATAGMSSP